MATIFWHKDDKDETQVKEVHVPGVFPPPSSKINSSTVTAARKPWLRPTGPKQVAGPRKPDAPTKQSKGPAEVSNAEQKMKSSVSLKDLSSQDKRRVANLIKELAKAGEERRVAVDALQKERTHFQGKEELLKREQEKLIMERDKLRENIIEYQFLINQYNKEIQYEHNAPTTNEGYPLTTRNHISQNVGFHPNSNLVGSEDNLKPPMSAREPEDKMPVYYNIVGSKDSPNLREVQMVGSSSPYHPKQFAFHRKPMVESQYRASNEENPPSNNRTQPENTMMGLHIDRDSAINRIYGTPSGLAERESFAREGISPNTQYTPPSQHFDKGTSEIQSTLLEQQDKLFDQQKAIQEQLKNLEIIQQRYAKDFSQIVTYSENLKNVLTNGKNISGSADRDDCIREAENKEVVLGASKNRSLQRHNQHLNNFNNVSRNLSSNDTTMKSDSMLYEKIEASNLGQEEGLDFKMLPNRELHVDRDSLLNKSVEQIPGYLLHAPNKLQTSEAEMYNDSLDSDNDIAHGIQSLMGQSLATQNKELSKSAKRGSFAYTPHEILPTFKSPRSFRRGGLSAKRNDTIPSNHSYETSFTSKHLAKRSSNVEMKQQSLLNSLEDIENDLPRDKESGIFNLGSYAGFAEGILEGNFKNEQIFASTDFSDNDSESEENDLLEEVFFLKRF